MEFRLEGSRTVIVYLVVDCFGSSDEVEGLRVVFYEDRVWEVKGKLI